MFLYVLEPFWIERNVVSDSVITNFKFLETCLMYTCDVASNTSDECQILQKEFKNIVIRKWV